MAKTIRNGTRSLLFLFLQVTCISAVSWLENDNQVLYRLDAGETKRIELNTTSISETSVYITVSPCNEDIKWAVFKGNSRCSDDKLRLLYEHNSEEAKTFPAIVSENDRYLLQLSSKNGGTAAVSVRGETTPHVRLRLKAKSKRKLTANWDPSPVDPQATVYCLVASQKKKYTSLCAAQYDAEENKGNRKDDNSDTLDINARNEERTREGRLVHKMGLFDTYKENFFGHKRRKKFSRRTIVTDEDPVVAYVGDHSHHLIENLDLTKELKSTTLIQCGLGATTRYEFEDNFSDQWLNVLSESYFVSLFGVGDDRRAGSLLAWTVVRPRTSTAKKLKQDQPYKMDLKGRTTFYYKAAVSFGGLWLAVSSCGGAVDLEVLARGKRLAVRKNTGPYSKIFVPAPSVTSSFQEAGDEDSVQFDSGSEESKMRYVIKLSPSCCEESDNSIRIELLASSSQWGANAPELAPEDGATVREIRPHRSCKSVHIAFLPATHHTADSIRYCIFTRESPFGENLAACSSSKRGGRKTCISQPLPNRTKVITQKITGLRAGKKYAIQVTAWTTNFAVPYNILYAETNVSCKNV